MRIKIYVTKRDIDNGERGDAELCAVSLALQRRLKIDQCEVFSFTILKHTREYGPMECNLVMFNKKGQEFYGIVPQAAIDFIGRFDDQKKVSPFRFSMEAPAELIKGVKKPGPSPTAVNKVIQTIEADLINNPVFMNKKASKVLV